MVKKPPGQAGMKRTKQYRNVLRPKGLRKHEFLESFIKKSGTVDAKKFAQTLQISAEELAKITGLKSSKTVSKKNYQKALETHPQVTEMLEIIARAREWAGSEPFAFAWYKSVPIPSLNGRTPEALVKAGKATEVRDYLDHLALGGFA